MVGRMTLATGLAVTVIVAATGLSLGGCGGGADERQGPDGNNPRASTGGGVPAPDSARKESTAGERGGSADRSSVRSSQPDDSKQPAGGGRSHRTGDGRSHQTGTGGSGDGGGGGRSGNSAGPPKPPGGSS